MAQTLTDPDGYVPNCLCTECGIKRERGDKPRPFTPLFYRGQQKGLLETDPEYYARRIRELEFVGLVATERPDEPSEELSVLISCMRESAQDLLGALHRKGWKLVRA